MIYFTSDTHFNHNRGFIYEPRGFKSVEEADETIIKNWNATVTNNDEIYVLGDFFLGPDISYVKDVLHELNGKIHLIRGNHDSPAKITAYKACSKILDICWATQIEYRKRLFYLSHYPTITGDKYSNPSRAVINLFGHTHSKDKFLENYPYAYNVAVDAHNNKPVSIDEIYSDIICK